MIHWNYTVTIIVTIFCINKNCFTHSVFFLFVLRQAQHLLHRQRLSLTERYTHSSAAASRRAYTSTL